jgi:hypothetical protein
VRNEGRVRGGEGERGRWRDEGLVINYVLKNVLKYVV